jgi:hypothetical protein
MGSATLMMGIKGTEVVRDHLEVTSWFRGWIGLSLPMAAMLCFHPAIHRVFHVEHRSCVGTATNSAKRNPQRIGDRVS